MDHAVPAELFRNDSGRHQRDPAQHHRRASARAAAVTGRATVAFDWQPHEPDPARAHRYVRDGFWNDESLGEILVSGLRDAGAQPFVVRSDRRPYRGTLA